MSNLTLIKGILALCVCLAVFASDTAKAAVVIEQIDIRNNQRLEANTILSKLQIKVGDEVEDKDISEAVKNLYSYGYFNDIKFFLEGNILVLEVQENALVNTVTFEGNRRISDEILQIEVYHKSRSIYSPVKILADVKRIVTLYNQQGRFAVRVEPKLIFLDNNQVNLVFEIEEGKKSQIKKLVFIGNEYFGNDKIKDVLLTEEWRWYRFIGSRSIYDYERLRADQARIARLYRNAGFAKVKIKTPIAEISLDGKEFYITYHINEGKRYKIANIEVESRIADIASETLSEVVKVSEDNYISEDTIIGIEEKIKGITEEYGYAFANVLVKESYDDENLTVGLKFIVEKSANVYIGQITVKGNFRTKERVIRQNLRIAEGDRFSRSLLSSSQRRLYNLGFFKKVDLDVKQGKEKDLADINIEVEESPTGGFQFGVGISSLEKYGALKLQYNDRNLAGTGRSLYMDVSYSGYYKKFETTFIEPYFLAKGQSGGITLSLEKEEVSQYQDYGLLNVGTELLFGYSYSNYLGARISYGYSLEQISAVGDNAPSSIKNNSDRIEHRSYVTYRVWYDRLNNRIEPSKGYYLQYNVKYMGLFGNVYYISHTGLAESYYKLGKTQESPILKLKLRAGVVSGLNGQHVQVQDRFYLGGETFRGFDYRGIGPRETSSGSALGGLKYWVGSSTLFFSLGLPPEYRIRGLSYFELGSLSGHEKIDEENSEMIYDTGNIRTSVGYGIEWFTPVGPINFLFTTPIQKETHDRELTFLLSLGVKF